MFLADTPTKSLRLGGGRLHVLPPNVLTAPYEEYEKRALSGLAGFQSKPTSSNPNYELRSKKGKVISNFRNFYEKVKPTVVTATFPDLPQVNPVFARLPWEKKLINNFRIPDTPEGNLKKFPEQRNIPSIQGTTGLSPYMHWGLVSTEQAYSLGGEEFKRQVVWREYCKYLCHHFSLESKAVQPKFDTIPWSNDCKDITAWKTGMTGIPIVDAGMRELWNTGNMHNRVRMIVGSFLVKNLLVDWRIGNQWFMETLVDADVPNNAFGWQWCAGSGADAAPYFRIFNPVIQAKRWDSTGAYIKQWVPELKDTPVPLLFAPWKGKPVANYPQPIVDLKASYIRALKVYKAALTN